MNVRPILDSEKDAYDACARRFGSLFHRPEWTALFGAELIRCGIFDKGGSLRGGFHLYREQRFGITILRDPPFTPEFGPFLEIRSKHPVAILEERRESLSVIAEYLDGFPRSLRFLSLGRGIDDALPFYWRKYKVIPNYTFVIDLTKEASEIVAGLSTSRRNDITKATRDGLVAELSTDKKLLKDLILDSFTRKKGDPKQAYLDKILFEFAHESNSYGFVARQADRPLACCLIVHDDRTAYYLMGGYRSENGHHGAGALALIESIKHAREIGITRFDFEGSIIPPIERYFRGFGGALTPYFSINKAWLPFELMLKFIRREYF